MTVEKKHFGPEDRIDNNQQIISFNSARLELLNDICGNLQSSIGEKDGQTKLSPNEKAYILMHENFKKAGEQKISVILDQTKQKSLLVKFTSLEDEKHDLYIRSDYFKTILDLLFPIDKEVVDIESLKVRRAFRENKDILFKVAKR